MTQSSVVTIYIQQMLSIVTILHYTYIYKKKKSGHKNSVVSNASIESIRYKSLGVFPH